MAMLSLISNSFHNVMLSCPGQGLLDCGMLSEEAMVWFNRPSFRVIWDWWSFPDYGTKLSTAHAWRDMLPCYSGVKWGMTDGLYGEVGINMSIRYAKARRHLKVLNKAFPPTSATDARHMTAHLADWAYYHLRQEAVVESDARINNSGVWPATRAARLRRMNKVLRAVPVGSSQQLVMGAVALTLGHQEYKSVQRCYIDSKILLTGHKEQQRRCKAISTLVRKTDLCVSGAELTAAQVPCLGYYDMFFGRTSNVSDWAAERSNRCTFTWHIRGFDGLRGLWNHPSKVEAGDAYFVWRDASSCMDHTKQPYDPQFYDDLRDALLEICKPLVTARNTKEDFASFIRRRQEWMASGSSGGYSLEVERQGVKRRVKGKKRAWAESITVAQMEGALHRGTPREHARASEKMENGKARAIYGVAPEHYVINTYGTKGMEERLHLVPGLEKGASGEEAFLLEAKRAFITSNKKYECTMLDYADFNRHHTPQAQAILFEVFADLGKAVGSHPDWILANEWVAKSKYNMSVEFPGNDGVYEKVRQGMFSGTRSTDLLNTLLNLAYYNVGKQYVNRLAGLKPVNEYHVHQGDDVWVTSESPTWARVLYYVLHQQGFLFQESKQMFGNGRGEYLRVLYKDGRGYGYTARALANYILRPVQNDQGINPVAWARAISDAAHLLVRRGLTLSGANAIFHDGMSYWALARAHELDQAPVALPRAKLWAPSVLGGLALSPPGYQWTQIHDVRVSADLPEFSSTIKASEFNLPCQMADDWIAHVSEKKLRGMDELVINAERLREAIVSENHYDVLNEIGHERGWHSYKVQLARRVSGRAWSDLDQTSMGQYCANIEQALEVAGGLIKRQPVRNLRIPSIESALTFSMRDYIGGRPRLAPMHACVEQMINRSRFKSDTRLAQAFSLSRLQALAYIVINARLRSGTDNITAALIQKAVSKGCPQWAELITGGGLHLSPTLQSFQNHGLYNVLTLGVAEVLARSRSHAFNQVQELWEENPSFWRCWLRAGVSPGLHATAVLY